MVPLLPEIVQGFDDAALLELGSDGLTVRG